MTLARGIDVNARYLPIARDLKARFGKELSQQRILEVGSGDYGIARYLDLPVTGVDISFGNDLHPKLIPIKHEGYALPFEDQSFDIVVSTDMLEHVPPDQRLTSVSEMLRVARKIVYLAVPVGKLAEAQDKKFDELYYKYHGKRDRFLREHVEYGLPTIQDLQTMLSTALATHKRAASVRHFKSYNLSIRSFEHRVYVTPALWAKAVFRFLHVFSVAPSLLSFGECYRAIFVIDLSAS